MRVNAHAIFTHACIFTRVHACMDNVASLPFSLSYNATVLVTLFFPTRPWVHIKGPGGRQNRGGSGINKLYRAIKSKNDCDILQDLDNITD